eukprot:scpid45922/ scgid1891/ Large neutral amino acids transporter small subunit 1; 4F2 light chain; CD98 light chain; Integral membrane protein E16; L-type amino acid transporter 1; Solute carrier family 7 member 5; y+ system cationic amino acid transporter
MTTLKKEFTFMDTLALIVASIIGSGIFLTPNVAYKEVGSPAMLLLVFALTGVWSLLAQLCYAELGTLIPRSGAEYAFYKYAFGTGLPAFMLSWISCTVIRALSLSIVMLTFARYSVAPFVGDCGLTDWAYKLIAIATLGLVCTINCISVKWLAKAQRVFFALKIAALGGIALMGFVALGQKRQSYLSQGFNGTSTSIGGITVAFYGAQWAFLGWSEANNFVQELSDPKILVKAAFLAIPIVTLCYELVIVAYMAILPEDTFRNSKAVAVAAGKEMIGSAALYIFPLIVSMSCFASAIGILLASSRLVHEAGKYGDLPPVLGLVHNTLVTPIFAVWAQCLFPVVFIALVDVYSLVTLLGFTSGVVISASMFVLLKLRRAEPNTQRGIKVPIILPIIVLIPSVVFAIVPFVRSPLKTGLTALAMMSSIPIYFVAVSRRWGTKLHPWLNRASEWTVVIAQRFFNVS